MGTGAGDTTPPPGLKRFPFYAGLQFSSVALSTPGPGPAHKPLGALAAAGGEEGRGDRQDQEQAGSGEPGRKQLERSEPSPLPKVTSPGTCQRGQAPVAAPPLYTYAFAWPIVAPFGFRRRTRYLRYGGGAGSGHTGLKGCWVLGRRLGVSRRRTRPLSRAGRGRDG
ncbi:unnamed protein product [Natator depressus]